MKKPHELSRRNFLAAAGAAAALPYFIPSSALGKAGAVAPGNRLVMGAMGMGGMGGINLRGFLSCEDVQVVAVCDVDAVRLHAAKETVDKHYGNKDCAVYRDFREMIARTDIDLLLNATPDHWHAIPAILAAKAGKDVYSEKPMCLTIAEGRVMADTMKRYGTVFQCGTQRRSTACFRFCCDAARSGNIGQIKEIYAHLNAAPVGPSPKAEPVPDGFDYDLWLGQAPEMPYQKARCHGAFRFNFDYSGGGITDIGAHYLDLAQIGNGTEHTGPVEFEGWGKFPDRGIYNTPTDYEVTATYANGVKLHFKPGPWMIKFVGTEGWISVNEQGVLDASPKSLLEARAFARFNWTAMEGHPHHRDFLNCVKTRGTPAANAEVAQRSVTLCHIANLLLRLGRKKLRWNPDAEQFVNDPEANAMLARAPRPPWHL